MTTQTELDRRNFLRKSSLLAIGAGGLFALPNAAHAAAVTEETDINVIGPKQGYSPQVGTLVSMMNWMRQVILGSVEGMSVKELDYLHDDKSNSIGAMLLHLAATERFYYLHTVDGRAWGEWEEADKNTYNVAMSLGDEARETIRGNDLEFYLKKLSDVREGTLKAFAKRDDQWLLSVDKEWFWGPTNNYCKWFHVCEHESNHNGQIKYIKSRIS
jgi:hypothetical protein